MRGINTNNYAESAIAILKDIVFKGLQVFEFITLTLKMYYERRLLTVTFNRIIGYKGHQKSIIKISLSKMEVTFFTM